MATKKKDVSAARRRELLAILEKRFAENRTRHPALRWNEVEERLLSMPAKLWSLSEMEASGGEPDVVAREKGSGELRFVDCSPESPQGRRSLCYDQAALASRKANKPAGSAAALAEAMGAELLGEEAYRALQRLGEFDTKTSSWLLTPSDIRTRGGAIFGDFRYGTVFIYHNGAESYYAARGFRCVLRV